MTALAPSEAQEPQREETSSPARWSLTYHPGIDGLRAVVMAAVLMYHAEIPWARGGYLGVSQFFTLSGFLVTSLLLRAIDRDDGVDFKRFWVRRIRRLWPASLAALAGIAVYGATVADAAQGDVLPKQIAAAGAHMANWLFISEDTSYINQFAAPSPVLHFWSLSLEEQFYLLLPLGLIAVLRVSRSRLALGAVVATAILLCTAWMVHLSVSGSSIDRVYYGTDTRVGESLAGVLLAVVFSAVRVPRSSRVWTVLGWVGTGAFALTVWMFSAVSITETALWRGGIVGFSVVSCLVIGGVLSGAGPLRLLSWGPAAAMGRITYGLYLYHWPIYLWLTTERTGLSQWPLFSLRLAVTFAAAILSYHLLEMPFRSGAVRNSGRFRFLLWPTVTVSLVVVSFATAGRGADDRFATLRGDDPESAPTSATVSDPLLNVLVVTDAVGEPIARRLEDLAAADETLDVVRAGPFHCGEVVGAAPERTCRAWLETWPTLIGEHDPDVVFLFVDTWPVAELQRVAGGTATPPAEMAAELIRTGLDLLTAHGANVVWGANPDGLLDGDSRQTLPFRMAMSSLLRTRSDLRSIEYLPTVPAKPDDAYLTRATGVVLEGLRAHRRAPSGDIPRVMVVGDSQARSVGFGLERLESETRGAVVWNVAAQGCGIVNGGTVRDVVTDTEQEPDQSCVEAVEAWSSNVEEFDPDIVLVLSSLRDVQDRRLDAAGDFGVIGDGGIDNHLLSAYTEAVDTLSAGGATVVWMKPPCVRYESPFGGGGDAPSAFEPERIERLNDHVLPALARARPDDVVLYGLDEILCPRGEFLDDTGDLTDIRPDGIHLSPEASLWIADRLHRDVVERYGG